MTVAHFRDFSDSYLTQPRAAHTADYPVTLQENCAQHARTAGTRRLYDAVFQKIEGPPSKAGWA